MFKIEDNDYMKTLFKKLMIKRALKNNFDTLTGKATTKNDKKSQESEKIRLKSNNINIETIRKINE